MTPWSFHMNRVPCSSVTVVGQDFVANGSPDFGLRHASSRVVCAADVGIELCGCVQCWLGGEGRAGDPWVPSLVCHARKETRLRSRAARTRALSAVPIRVEAHPGSSRGCAERFFSHRAGRALGLAARLSVRLRDAAEVPVDVPADPSSEGHSHSERRILHRGFPSATGRMTTGRGGTFDPILVNACIPRDLPFRRPIHMRVA